MATPRMERYKARMAGGPGSGPRTAASAANEKAAAFHQDAANMHKKGEADAPSMTHAAVALTAKAVTASHAVTDLPIPDHLNRAVMQSDNVKQRVTSGQSLTQHIVLAHEAAASAHKDAALYYRRK